MVRNWTRLSQSAARLTAAAIGAYPNSQIRSRSRTVIRAGSRLPGGGISTVSVARKTSVPNTRRIGCAKLPAVYCVAGLASGNPQSQAGARRTAREARRWMANAARNPDIAINVKMRMPL